jgi:hypothetical protein
VRECGAPLQVPAEGGTKGGSGFLTHVSGLQMDLVSCSAEARDRRFLVGASV